MLNALLENYRVIINGVDVSAAVDGEQWLGLVRPKFSEEGVYPTTGTVALLEPPAHSYGANFFDPRANRTQWQRGRPVAVDLMFGGVWQRIFTGYVLQRPATPVSTDPGLSIPVGCELAYRDREGQAGDLAGIRLGQSTTRTVAIANIWAGIGGQGTWAGSIPEYPINYNAPKTSGSYVQQMGAFAIGAGYGLYCDRNGDLQAARLTYRPTSYLSERTDNDSFLSPLDGSEPPAAEVKAVLAGREVSPTPLTRTIGPVVESGVLNLKIGPAGGVVKTGVKRVTTITDAWQPGFKALTRLTKVEVPSGRAANSPLEVRSLTQVDDVYSADDSGKLLSRTTTALSSPGQLGIASASVIVVNGVVLAAGELVPSDKKIERWEYTGELPTRYVIEDYDYLIKSSGTRATVDEYLKERETEDYDPLDGDQWLKTISQEKRLFLSDDTVFPLGDVLVEQGPDVRPRQPQRHTPDGLTRERTYTGSAYYDTAGDETDPAVYEFPYGVSDEQAQALAQLFGAVLIGREMGWRISHELTEQLATAWTPASCAKVTLPSGAIIGALIDGFSINCNQGEALVSYDLVDLGQIGTDSATLIPPYSIQVVGVDLTSAETLEVAIAGLDVGGGATGADLATTETLDPGQWSEGVNNVDLTSAETLEVDQAGEIFTTAVLAIERGGTGGRSAAEARANLELTTVSGDLVGSITSPEIRQALKPLAKGEIVTHDGSTQVKLTPGSDAQILSSDSGEATGYRWIDNTASLPAGAKGSILAHNGVDWVVVPVGADDQILYADSTEAPGVRWDDAPTGGGGGGGGTNDDAATFIARLTGTYSTAQEDAIAAFINGLITDGLYSTDQAASVIDCLYIHALQNAVDAVLDISGNYDGINSGMTFTAGAGMTGNGTNSYIDTGFNPTVEANASFTQNSATLGSYSNTNSSNNGYSIGSQEGTVQTALHPRFTDGNFYGRVNQAASGGASVPNSTGLFIATRPSAGSVVLYKDGVSVGSLSHTSTGVPDRTIYIGAKNDGTANSPSSRELALNVVAGGMNGTQVSNFNSRVSTLLAAL